MRSLGDELNRWFSPSAFGCASSLCSPTDESTEFELVDSGNALHLSAKVPGLAHDDLELTATSDLLTLRGKRRLAVPEGYTVRHRERRGYEFERSFRLPTRIDSERIDAQLTNGILTVTLSKAAASQPRHITVRAS